MNDNTPDILNIEKEIEVKRLNPDYLAKVLIKEIKKIDLNFDTSFSEIQKYRKQFKNWKNKIAEPGKQMNILTKKTDRIIQLTAKIDQLAKAGKDYSKEDKEFAEIMEYIQSNDIDFSGWSKESFKDLDSLVIEREKLLTKNLIGTMANSSLLNNEVTEMLGSASIFTISFLASFYVGDFLENQIKELGPISSKLIPALLFFISLDKLVKKIEENLAWKRVRYLNKKYDKLILNITRQNIVLAELEKNAQKTTS